MAEQTFEVVLHVSASDLTTVLAVVDKTVQLVGVRPVNQPVLLTKTVPNHHKKFVPGLRGIDLVNNLAADGRVHQVKEFCDAFECHGFNRNSATSRLSEACKNGTIKLVGEGIYQKV